MSPIAAPASTLPATLSAAVPVPLPSETVAAAPAPAPHAISGLTVRYGRRTAVAGVSLEVREGEVHALLGRNGAGKSSLVRCLLGQQRPSAGSARLFGRDVWRRRAALLAEVGVVLEQPDAPPHATARQLAGLCRPLYRRWYSRGFEERLRRFAVPADVPFGHLSKGQQRQVALALALAAAPRLLILDDPTLGLDVVARRAFFDELIGDLADRGTTVFLATHELAAVERIADRVAILAGGRLLLDEELESLKQRCRRLRLPPGPAAGASTGGAAAVPAGFTLLHRDTRDWGTELVVTDFDEERFHRWQAGLAATSAPPAGAGGPAIEIATLTLEEIFLALDGAAAGAGPEPADPRRQGDRS
jgi:ABC-2 type transport system ATP-binding protein